MLAVLHLSRRHHTSELRSNRFRGNLNISSCTHLGLKNLTEKKLVADFMLVVLETLSPRLFLPQIWTWFNVMVLNEAVSSDYIFLLINTPILNFFFLFVHFNSSLRVVLWLCFTNTTFCSSSFLEIKEKYSRSFLTEIFFSVHWVYAVLHIKICKWHKDLSEFRKVGT